MISIILPVSRRDYLKPVFDCLEALYRPPDTELLIITDGDSELEMAVDRRLDSVNYAKINVVSFGKAPVEDIASRRFRISEIHNMARKLVLDSEYVLLYEDDTVMPPDALVKMLDTLELYEDAAFVEGVELGRHKSKYIGGWLVDDIENPTRIESVMPPYVGNPIKNEINKILQPIDAGGLYCALIRAELYRNHNFEPYDKVGTNGLSCDLNFGLYLRRLGYKCYIDWSIQCDHIGVKGSVNLGNTKPVQVQFAKIRNKWESRVV